uniref:Mariner transposase [Bombyx mori] n=1 Tax=Lepeophtheirus salmonis TaxID=72036 RepID=A0A0K2T547_LEPSM
MGDPPYNPDLAPHDFFLLTLSKKKNAWSTIFVAKRCYWSV